MGSPAPRPPCSSPREVPPCPCLGTPRATPPSCRSFAAVGRCPRDPYGPRPAGARHRNGGSRAVDRGRGGLGVGGTASADTLTFAVDSVTSSTSTEQSKTERADAVRVAADRAPPTRRAPWSPRPQRPAPEGQKRPPPWPRPARPPPSGPPRPPQRKRVIANAKRDPKAAARDADARLRLRQSQFGCLERLWTGESGWNYTAANASSGAYGIPQSLPGRKMATVGSDWRTNPVTQIKWGLGYIKRSYGSPCNALSQWNARSPHWY